MDYKVGDLVWVKLRGFPHWPARIDEFEKTKCKLFYFGTHEIGKQPKNSLLPFAPFRDKYALYRGTSPTVLLEGVLEAEMNPKARPNDTLSTLTTDTQIWMVMGNDGQDDFRKRFPKRAKDAAKRVQEYNKEVKLARIKAGKDPELISESESETSDNSDDAKESDGGRGDSGTESNSMNIASEEETSPVENNETGKVTWKKEPKKKVEINTRKRINSEIIKTGSPSSSSSTSPKRKKRRTQSESMVADIMKNHCKPTTSRARENALVELTNCLRYSLRQSELNDKAAAQILMDIEGFELSPKDNNIEILRTSLELICRLDKLPEIQSQSRGLLSKLTTNTS